jgi:transposase-like protein
MKGQNTLSIDDMNRLYGSDSACEEALSRLKWPDGFVCPACGAHGEYTIRTRRHLLHECKACGKQSTAIVGTVFEKTHTPLHKWFMAIYMMSKCKTGYPAKRLSEDIGVAYNTAWLMLHKIRNAMGVREAEGMLRGLVEMDESYVSGKAGEGPGDGAGGQEKPEAKTGVKTGAKTEAKTLPDPKGTGLGDTAGGQEKTRVEPEAKPMPGQGETAPADAAGGQAKTGAEPGGKTLPGQGETAPAETAGGQAKTRAKTRAKTLPGQGETAPSDAAGGQAKTGAEPGEKTLPGQGETAPADAAGGQAKTKAKTEAKTEAKTRGRGTSKTKVLGAVQVGFSKAGHSFPSRIKLSVVEAIDSATVTAKAAKWVAEGSTVRTDCLSVYNKLGAYSHIAEKSDPAGNPEHLKWYHIVIGNLQMVVRGAHHGLGKKYLQRYLDEFCYRFNRKGMVQTIAGPTIFHHLLKLCAQTKTITYPELTA